MKNSRLDDPSELLLPPLMPAYARADLEVERGEGAYLFDVDGTRYLDFVAGIAVDCLGHCHPTLVAAIEAQAKKIWHCSNLFRIPGQERLAARLVEATFADTVFFGNSGAEAVECAIKTARKYHYTRGAPERYRVITFDGAFHGRTLATIAASGQEKLLKGFGPAVDGFDQVPFDDLKAVAAAIGAETAAILIEPIQGEGGVRPASREFLQGLRDLADSHGLLLIYDEIQCGMGRTGKLFAHEWAGVSPDIMAIAKGIGGGFPLGACLATAKAAEGMTVGSHGSTYGGNPLAMAVGNAVLDEILKPGFLKTVIDTADYARGQLVALANRHKAVVDGVRGMGLMLGLRLHIAPAELIPAARERGLLLAAAGDNVVRLLPPLIIDRSHIDEAVAVLDEVLITLAPADA